MSSTNIRRFVSIIVIGVGFAFLTMPLQALEPLSDGDLKPFCNNEKIWGGFDVSESECLASARRCSKQNTAKNIIKATEQLYACVFDDLGIHFDDSEEDEEDWAAEDGGEFDNYFDENMNDQGEYR